MYTKVSRKKRAVDSAIDKVSKVGHKMSMIRSRFVCAFANGTSRSQKSVASYGRGRQLTYVAIFKEEKPNAFDCQW